MPTMVKRIVNKLNKPNHTWKRFGNACLNFLSRALKSPRAFGFPEMIFIEPTNICNLKCPLCPTGSGKLKRRQGFLSLANFKKIIDEIGGYVYYITLSNYGEPFLNKEIFEMISYAKKKGLIVSITSNAQLISESYASRIVDLKLDYISISLDGVSQSSYEKYRIGGSLEKVIETVRVIRRERERKRSSLPLIQMQFLITKYNENELGEITKLANELKADRLEFKKICNLGSFPTDIEEMEIFSPRDLKYRAYKFENGHVKWNTLKVDQNFCPMAWNYPVINWDGSVFPCCFVSDSFDLGNVLETSFKNVWNNKKFICLRKTIAKDKALLAVCSRCPVNFYDEIVDRIYFDTKDK